MINRVMQVFLSFEKKTQIVFELFKNTNRLVDSKVIVD